MYMAQAIQAKESIWNLMVLPHYDYSDYERWEGRWELIEGVPFAMTPSPVKRHQLISSNIEFELREKLKGCPRCRSYFDLDWIVNRNTVVCPDNMVVCDDDLTEDFVKKTPEVIFEILSQSTKEKDRINKFLIYQREGVKYYILVNPDDFIAEVYELKDGKYSEIGKFRDEICPFNIGCCVIEFDFSNVFKGLTL